MYTTMGLVVIPSSVINVSLEFINTAPVSHVD